MRRLFVLLVALMLVAAACGGDSSNDGADDGVDQTTTTQPAESGVDPDDEAPPSTEADNGESDAEGSGESNATVTIGSETYEFTSEGALIAQCLADFFGVMSVQLPMLDESGAQVGGLQLVALHEGTDPAVVEEVTGLEVSVNDMDWIADEGSDIYQFYPDALEAGMSQVDSYEIVGRTVTGTATFVREGSLSTEPEVMQGSFEATCGEDRTS